MPVDPIAQVKPVGYATRLNSTRLRALEKLSRSRRLATLIDSTDRPCTSHPARLTFPRFQVLYGRSMVQTPPTPLPSMYSTHQYVLGLAAGRRRGWTPIWSVHCCLLLKENPGDIIEVCPCLKRDNCARLFGRHASRYLGRFHYMGAIEHRFQGFRVRGYGSCSIYCTRS